MIFILFASKRKMERGPDDAAAAYTTHAESEFGKRGRDMKGNNEWGATKWGAARCGAKRPKTSSASLSGRGAADGDHSGRVGGDREGRAEAQLDVRGAVDNLGRSRGRRCLGGTIGAGEGTDL